LPAHEGLAVDTLFSCRTLPECLAGRESANVNGHEALYCFDMVALNCAYTIIVLAFDAYGVREHDTTSLVWETGVQRHPQLD